MPRSVAVHLLSVLLGGAINSNLPEFAVLALSVARSSRTHLAPESASDAGDSDDEFEFLSDRAAVADQKLTVAEESVPITFRFLDLKFGTSLTLPNLYVNPKKSTISVSQLKAWLRSVLGHQIRSDSHIRFFIGDAELDDEKQVLAETKYWAVGDITVRIDGEGCSGSPKLGRDFPDLGLACEDPEDTDNFYRQQYLRKLTYWDGYSELTDTQRELAMEFWNPENWAINVLRQVTVFQNQGLVEQSEEAYKGVLHLYEDLDDPDFLDFGQRVEQGLKMVRSRTFWNERTVLIRDILKHCDDQGTSTWDDDDFDRRLRTLVRAKLESNHDGEYPLERLQQILEDLRSPNEDGSPKTIWEALQPRKG